MFNKFKVHMGDSRNMCKNLLGGIYGCDLNKKGRILNFWNIVVLASLWPLWLERNKRTFEDIGDWI